MNQLLNHASDETLNKLTPKSLPYPGDAAIRDAIAAKTTGKRKGPRLILRAGLVAAVLAVLSVGAFAAYERWHMPAEGERYEGGNLQIHGSETYTVPSMTTDPAASSDAAEPAALSDEWFIRESIAVLGTVNKLDVDATQLTVTRQKDQRWNREEVVVTFQNDADQFSEAVFDALDGNLIGATAFDREPEGDTPMADEAALTTAQFYYDRLPYAKGYEYSDVLKFDDHAWMFSFSKTRSVELDGETVTAANDYEQVRITIDPCSGSFQLSNCFYVPVLDDHQPGDTAVTKEQAMAAAEAAGIMPRGISWDSVTCELSICLPRPDQVGLHTGTGDPLANYRYSSVTRWGWRIRYSGRDEFGFAAGGEICIDLFTGELLCCDRVR